MSNPDFVSITTTALQHVTGGETQSFDQFAGALKNEMRGQYHDFVCKGAGLKGGPEFASKMFGAATTDADKIRALKMVKGYCDGSSKLPAAAPAFPF
jgi:hypothetical protein